VLKLMEWNVQTDNTQNLLSFTDLFSGLTAEQLARVGQHAHRKLFPAGTNIMTVEQPGEVVYIILSGTVKIHIEQADGRDVTLSILGRGDTVGEMSMIDSSGRSASAVTLEESLLLWMDKAAFQECLRDVPQISQNLVRVLAGRVRLANELIQALATLDVYGRVARQLLAFAEKYGEAAGDEVRIPIRLTQGDIAELVGASRKRVNQVMVAFKGQNLIAENDGKITVKDRVGLAKYCR
jgi:CRP/FNR family transcriptional regulator, cyclic AMP receptor protein